MSENMPDMVSNKKRTKVCTKCGKEKEIKYFGKDKKNKDGLNCGCKECVNEQGKEYKNKNKEKIKIYKNWYGKNNKEKIREYRENNREKIKKQKKGYYLNNKEKEKEKIKEYYENNKEHIEKRTKEYINSPMPFNSTAKIRKEIELYEEIAESIDNYLMCKCAYCGEGFEPTRLQMKNRLNAIYGSGSTRGECRLYCSNSCKCNCPIYNQILYSKDQKPATSREVQPELRQMVFNRDNYTCQKCNTHRDNLEVGIHCHHKEGILGEPLQSADTDMCITLCEDCHREVHGIDGCGYQEMKCA